jgi:alkaline phosphatase
MPKTLSKMRPIVIVLLTVALMLSVTLPASVAACPPATQAKNIILMISDGGGFNHVLAADYYQYGAAGTQVYEDFPVQVACSTFEYESIVTANDYFPYPYEPPYPSENPDYVFLGYNSTLAWSDFDYLPWMVQGSSSKNNHTDSASAITALVTGTKTKDGYLGVDINKNPVINIVEILETQGKATGVVSSAPFSHATPAGCAAHIDNRNDYFTIADMLLYESALDAIISTGAPDYDQDGNPVDPYTYEHETDYISLDTWADIADGSVLGADADGDSVPDEWTVIRTLAEFQDMATGPTPSRVLGIPQVHETMQMKRTGGNGSEDAYVIPLTPDMPNLADMSKAALNVLDNDPDGFFVMIEGAAVDWAGHERFPGRTIEEQIDFNLAVDAVVDWVETNSNWNETLLIVTADHETGYIWGPDSGPGDPPTWNPVINNGAGNMPGFEFYSELWHPAFPGRAIGWHTNTLVPVYAKGPGADLFNTYAVNTDPIYGPYLDNIEVFKVMVEASAYATIDIKPYSYSNTINRLFEWVVPVAILTTDNFDATTVDPATVVFAGAEPICNIMKDVNYDGDLDMLLYFNTHDLELTCESTEAYLTGETTDGIPIIAKDKVNIIPKGKWGPWWWYWWWWW